MLEIGKKYKLRNGLETSPLRLSKNGSSYMFEAEVKEEKYSTNSVLSWKKNGKFLTDDIEHEKDIII